MHILAPGYPGHPYGSTEDLRRSIDPYAMSITPRTGSPYTMGSTFVYILT
jgi:hypothetical protein